MSFLAGVLLFILGLLISIALHEVGHMVPAKRFGVKVPEYFIGFGPTLWSTKRGETTYGIKAILLGGYVRLAGMYPASTHPGRGGLAEEARAETRADLGPGEENRAFSALTVPRKLVVMLSGPLTNWLLAFVLMAVAVVGIGIPTYTARLDTVQQCLQTGCEEPDTPAALAGLEAGDVITSWAGTPVADWEDLVAAIHDGGTQPVTVTVERDGQQLQLAVTPVESAGSPYVGVSPSIEMRRGSLTTVPALVWDATVETFRAVVTLPTQLWDVATSLITGSDDSDRNVLSIVGVGQIAGEITSSSATQYSTAMRAVDLLSLLASMNIALFVFNLFPLLPLDGGHVAGALWEGLRRQIARLRGRADPGPVDLAPLLPLAYGVILALVAMTVILVWADVVQPIGG